MSTIEGYIKFNCRFTPAAPPASDLVEPLLAIRRKLKVSGLIGVDGAGVGFGNVSARIGQSNQFVITGTQTAGIEPMTAEHFATVTSFNIEQNKIECQGMLKASAESLTHGAIYLARADCNCVIHIHSSQMWNEFLIMLPTTDSAAAYGTPEIAVAVQELARAGGECGIAVMGGHRDGIIAWGPDGSRTLEQITSRFYK